MFVRTLKTFPSDCLDEDDFLPEISDAILAPNGDVEIYALSLYLYGVYNEQHFSIVVTDKNYFADWDWSEEVTDVPFEVQERFAVFLKADSLKDKTIHFRNDKGDTDTYHLHYEHKPTRSNFWHFEFSVTKNEETERISKKIGSDAKKGRGENKRGHSLLCCKRCKSKVF